MKYIRTKDGIFTFKGVNTVTKVYDTPKCIEPWKYSDGTLVKEGEKFIRVNNKDYKVEDKDIADTIEELCDEFALISELEKRIIKPKELDRDCEGWTKEIGIPEGLIKVYGAIWTDKGLIYVAKMNEKGELELL